MQLDNYYRLAHIFRVQWNHTLWPPTATLLLWPLYSAQTKGQSSFPYLKNPFNMAILFIWPNFCGSLRLGKFLARNSILCLSCSVGTKLLHGTSYRKRHHVQFFRSTYCQVLESGLHVSSNLITLLIMK